VIHLGLRLPQPENVCGGKEQEREKRENGERETRMRRGRLQNEFPARGQASKSEGAEVLGRSCHQ